MNCDVHIERINNFEYSFAGSNRKYYRKIAKYLTFPNPDPFAYSPTIDMFDKHNLTFKIGMLKHLITELKEAEIKYTLIDFNYVLPKFEFDSRLTGKYLYQKKAVERFYKKRFGIIKVPTRGGKTFLASEIARLFLTFSYSGDNFLFVTDNTTLFAQAIRDIKEYFEPYGGIEIGEICSGKIQTDKRVTVAMVQTIQSTFSKRCRDNVKKRNLTKYLKELKFLAIDEIHDNSSEARMKIYRKCTSIEFLLCLSATPYKDDALKKNLKLQAWSGGIIFDISEQELREKGVLSNYMVFMLFLDHTDSWTEGDYFDVRKDIIVYNKHRNYILIKVMKILESLGLKTLVLFQDIAHGEEISKLTGFKFISGINKGDERELVKNNFLKEEGGFLLASDIFKKGVTLPEVEVMINVDGGLESSKTIQKKGRVLGVTEKKKRSLIIDFFDFEEQYFSKHSETRLDTYIKSIGEENVGLLDTSADDYLKVLRKWIKKWFEGDKDCLGTQ